MLQKIKENKRGKRALFFPIFHPLVDPSDDHWSYEKWDPTFIVFWMEVNHLQLVPLFNHNILNNMLVNLNSLPTIISMWSWKSKNPSLPFLMDFGVLLRWLKKAPMGVSMSDQNNNKTRCKHVAVRKLWVLMNLVHTQRWTANWLDQTTFTRFLK